MKIGVAQVKSDVFCSCLISHLSCATSLWKHFRNHVRLILAVMPIYQKCHFSTRPETRIIFAYWVVSPVRIRPMACGTRSLNCMCGKNKTGIPFVDCSKRAWVSGVFSNRNSSAMQIWLISKLGSIAFKTCKRWESHPREKDRQSRALTNKRTIYRRLPRYLCGRSLPAKKRTGDWENHF